MVRGLSVEGILVEDAARAFSAMFERDGRTVLRVLTLSAGWAEAEDLAAETFARAWRAWSRFQGDDRAARAWLLRIATNVARDHRRRGLRIRFLSHEENRIQPEAPSDQGRVELLGALASLRRDERDILSWRAAGLDYDEIASVRGGSPDAAKMAWSRAARRLKEVLGE